MKKNRKAEEEKKKEEEKTKETREKIVEAKAGDDVGISIQLISPYFPPPM